MTEILDIKTLAATKTWGRGRVYDSIAETIGHTPLVRLSKLAAAAKVKAMGYTALKFDPFGAAYRFKLAIIHTLLYYFLEAIIDWLVGMPPVVIYPGTTTYALVVRRRGPSDAEGG